MRKEWIRFATVPLLLTLATACDLASPRLEVRTFELPATDEDQLHRAGELIEPYVYSDRPSAPGSMSVGMGSITVRETIDNLDRIGRVLGQLDFAGAQTTSYRLTFQLIEANGSTETDPTITDVVQELRKTLRFEGYTLTGEAQITVQPDVQFKHLMETTDSRYAIRGQLDSYGSGHTLAVSFEQSYREGSPFATTTKRVVLSTTVGLRPTQTLVLGSVPVEGSATLLVVARMTEA